MDITRSFIIDGNIYPSIYNLLFSLKDNEIMLHHNEHMQIHPFAIYNKSTLRIFSSISNLIDYMQNQYDITKYYDNDGLFIRTKEIIESIIAFKDDTYQIMKCLFHKTAYKGKREANFADKWLEAINKPRIEKYRNNLRFLENINYINNQIKHNSGRLSFLHVKANLYFSSLGFFLDSVDEKGMKKPDENVHPRYNGFGTAYSYNYFIPLVFSFCYYISDYALETIKGIIKDEYNTDIDVLRVEDESIKIVSLLEKIQKIRSNVIFPDEYKKDFPQIDFDGQKIRLRMPAEKTYMQKFIPYKGYTARLLTSGDDITNEYALPYWK